jgi:hypothetical protein
MFGINIKKRLLKMDEKRKRFRWNALMDRFPDKDAKIVGAELGVWRGKMSEQLLKGMPNLHLLMIDRWAPPEPGDSYHTSGSEMALCDHQKFNQVFNEAIRRVKPFKERYTFFKMLCEEASKNIENHSLDFVFIDADHSYEGVKNDIIHWKDKVKPGSWLGGHDWGNFKKGNVKKAVEEFFDQIELDANSTWWVRL